MNIAILVLAAGFSSRMGAEDKLLQIIDGQTLLHRTTSRAIATGAQVFVALPDIDGPRAKTIGQMIGFTPVAVPNAKDGMSASIRAGVSAAKSADAIMILPADMPDLTTEDLRQVIDLAMQAPKTSIVQGVSADGKPGHPVLFPHDLFSDLTRLSGDSGAKPVLQRYNCRILQVPLPDQNALTDLDTPEAWAAWRGR